MLSIWQRNNFIQKCFNIVKVSVKSSFYMKMAGGKKSSDMDRTPLDYVGVNFNPDKYVFHLLMLLCLMFMVLYSIGTSIPAWYVLEEHAQNFSTCRSADRYVETHVRRSWTPGKTKLTLTSSLWYLNVKAENIDSAYHRFIPFLFIERERLVERTGNGMMIESVFPKCLTTVLTFAFLCLGVVFSFCASNRPSKLVYYGLSSVMIVAAITSWVTIALTNSEQHVLSAAFDLCIQQGAVKTSFLLQMITGSCGILAFTFGCILIHIAILINAKITAQNRDRRDDNDFDLAEKVQLLYTEPNFVVKKTLDV